MIRKNIGSIFDRNNRNNMNDNFEYLFEGRRKIDELNYRAEGILAEAKNTNNMNKNVQEQLDAIILENGNSEAEVVQARGGLPLLKDRLDKADLQLDRVANKTYSKSINRVRPLVTFYLDDGYQNDYDIVLPKASSLGIPVTICLYNESQLVNTPERLEELVNEHGWEIHGHTATHPELNTLTLDQQRKEMKDNIEFFKNMGYELEGLCYPKGYTNANTLKATREFFKVGMGSRPGINQSPIDTYHVHRYLTDSMDLDIIKSAIDKIKADGKGWIVIYSHTNIFGSNPTVKNRFFEMMDYVKDSGVETVTVKEAMKVYENTLDIGDRVDNGEYAKVGIDGTVEFTNIPFSVDYKNDNINSRAGTDFKTGFISINKFHSESRSDIPFNNGIGTLYTDRTFERLNITGQVAIQEFKDTNGGVHTRQYNSNYGWSDWVTQGVMNSARTNDYKNGSPVSDFPDKKITVTEFLSSHNSGLPESGIGTLITNRLNSAFTNYQLFYPYNNNNFYKRYWSNSSKDWSEWAVFSETVKHGETYNFGSLTAGESKTFNFNVNGTNNNMVPVVSFISGIAHGVIPFAYMAGNNTVVVKLINTSQNEVTVGSRPIRFLVQ